jgi:colicin import membrane protein
VIQVPERTPVVAVEVWMRYSADLRGLPQILMPLLKAPSFGALPMADDSAAHGERIAQFEAQQTAAELAQTQVKALTEQLAAEQASAAERVAQATAELQELRRQVEARQAGEDLANAQVKSLTDQLAAEQAKAAERAAQLEALQGTAGQAQASTVQLSEELAATRTRVQALVEEMAGERAQSAQRIAQLEVEGRNLLQQIEEYRVAASSAAAKDRDFHADMADLKAQHERQLAVMEEAQAHARREQAQLLARAEAAEAARQAAVKNAESATSRFELLSRRTSDLEGQLATAVLNGEICQAKLSELHRDCESARAELAHLRHERHLAHLDGMALRESIAELEKELAHLRHERHLAHLDGMALRESMAQLEMRLAEKTVETEALAGKCKRMGESFSWRCTAPLRWLRRFLIDAQDNPR